MLERVVKALVPECIVGGGLPVVRRSGCCDRGTPGLSQAKDRGEPRRDPRRIDVQWTAGGVEPGLPSAGILQCQIVNEARNDDIAEREVDRWHTAGDPDDKDVVGA